VEEHDSVSVGGTRNLEHENLVLLNWQCVLRLLMEKKFVGENMWWRRKRGGRRWSRGNLGVF
jgi:hypothetical protein